MSANQALRPDPKELRKISHAFAKMLGFGEPKSEEQPSRRKSGRGLKPLMSIKYHKKPKEDPNLISSTIDTVTQGGDIDMEQVSLYSNQIHLKNVIQINVS